MRLGIAVLMLALSGCAIATSSVPAAESSAGSAQVGAIRVSDAFISAPPGGVYVAGSSTTVQLQVSNSGQQADALTSATTPAAASVQLRTFGQTSERISIPSRSDKAQVSAQLINLSESVRSRQRVSLTLQFSGAGSVTVSVPVH